MDRSPKSGALGRRLHRQGKGDEPAVSSTQGEQ